MKIGKPMWAVLAVSIVAALAVSIVVLLSAAGAAQQPTATEPKAAGAAAPAPTSKDVMHSATKALGGPDSAQVFQMSRKAVGGAAFFEPDPYTLNSVSKTKYKPQEKESRTITARESYKNGKYHKNSTVTIQRIGKPFTAITITDMKNQETWESQSSEGFRWQKVVGFLDEPIFPPYKLKTDNLIFETEPIIETINGVDYYRVSAKFSSTESKNWARTYYFRRDNNFLYRTIDTETIKGAISSQTTDTFDNYFNVNDVFIPMKISTVYVGNKQSMEKEIEISNFAFSKDIPDSLFQVPTQTKKEK